MAEPPALPLKTFTAVEYGYGYFAQHGDTNSNKLIAAMEGMKFDTPKGPMTFRKEDHQAMQSMYHFRVSPNAKVGAQADLQLVKEILPSEMSVPIRNKR